MKYSIDNCWSTNYAIGKIYILVFKWENIWQVEIEYSKRMTEEYSRGYLFSYIICTATRGTNVFINESIN